MGVNTLILLPPDTRIGDVAKVVGILAGLKPEKQSLSGDSYACHVKGSEVKPSSIAEMANIYLAGDLVDGEENHYSSWHWEPEVGTGERLMMPRASAFWIAVGLKLVQFFGGSICYNDCDDRKPNYTRNKPRKANNPNDGAPWQHFQDEMLAIKPLTQSELHDANRFASYKLERQVA